MNTRITKQKDAVKKAKEKAKAIIESAKTKAEQVTQKTVRRPTKKKRNRMRTFRMVETLLHYTYFEKRLLRLRKMM